MTYPRDPKFKFSQSEFQPLDRDETHIQLGLNLVTFNDEDWQHLPDDERKIILNWLIERTMQWYSRKVVSGLELHYLHPGHAKTFDQQMRRALVEEMVQMFRDQFAEYIEHGVGGEVA